MPHEFPLASPIPHFLADSALAVLTASELSPVPEPILSEISHVYEETVFFGYSLISCLYSMKGRADI